MISGVDVATIQVPNFQNSSLPTPIRDRLGMPLTVTNFPTTYQGLIVAIVEYR